jgi:hypothetical protein
LRRRHSQAREDHPAALSPAGILSSHPARREFDIDLAA